MELRRCGDTTDVTSSYRFRVTLAQAWRGSSRSLEGARKKSRKAVTSVSRNTSTLVKRRSDETPLMLPGARSLSAA